MARLDSKRPRCAFCAIHLVLMADELTKPETPDPVEAKPDPGITDLRPAMDAVNSALQRPMHLGISSWSNGFIDFTVVLLLFFCPWLLRLQ